MSKLKILEDTVIKVRKVAVIRFGILGTYFGNFNGIKVLRNGKIWYTGYNSEK